MSLKYPALTATLSILGAICVGGIGLTAWQVTKHNNLRKSIEQKSRSITEIRSSDVFPSVKNREAAKANYDAALKREAELLSYLRGAKQFTPTPVEPANFSSELRSLTERLNKRLSDVKIRVIRNKTANDQDIDFSFGFRRYNTRLDGGVPPARHMADITKGRAITEFLVEQLAAAKADIGDNSPVILQQVDREAVEFASEAVSNTRLSAQRAMSSDEFKPAENDPLRSQHVVKTCAFKIVFTSRTDFFRNFLNKVYLQGYPIFLRDVTVSPAKEEIIKPEGAAGDAAATPATAAPSGPAFAATPAAPSAPTLAPGFSFGGETAAPAAPAADASGTPPAAPAAPDVLPNIEQVLGNKLSEFTICFEYVEPLDTTATAANPKP